MDRKCLASVIAFVLSGSAEALAQNPSIDTSRTGSIENLSGPGAASDQNRSVRAPIQLPALTVLGKRSRVHGFTVDTAVPQVRSDESSPAYTNGQIPYFGGALQNYLNVTGVDRMHNNILPFGANGVLPILRGRVELFGGIGGVHVSFQSPYTRPNSWLTQTSLGARVALDKEHHFWLGTTGYYLTNFADKTRQWGYGTADFTVRFGH